MTGRCQSVTALAASWAAAAMLGLLAPGPGPAQAAAGERCSAPAELTAASGALPHAAAAVSERRALRILVVGTASSTNAGTSTPAAAYPERLGAALTATLGGVTVTVQTRGGRGLTAAGAVTILDDGVALFRPDLVVWQTGTVDAVRGLDVDAFADAVTEGVEAALPRGADVVLMDMQFSRFSRAAVNYGPFRQALEAVAAANAGVVVFPRYELMRHWAASGQIDVERAPRAGWRAEADILHRCLAESLAALIGSGIRQAER